MESQKKKKMEVSISMFPVPFQDILHLRTLGDFLHDLGGLDAWAAAHEQGGVEIGVCSTPGT